MNHTLNSKPYTALELNRRYLGLSEHICNSSVKNAKQVSKENQQIMPQLLCCLLSENLGVTCLSVKRLEEMFSV